MTATQNVNVNVNVVVTGYGERAERDGKVKVVQTGARYGSVPGRAVAALRAHDWAAFFSLYRRSSKLRTSVSRRGDTCYLGVSYGAASLAEIALPRGAWQGMALPAAWALLGIEVA